MQSVLSLLISLLPKHLDSTKQSYFQEQTSTFEEFHLPFLLYSFSLSNSMDCVLQSATPTLVQELAMAAVATE